MNKRPGYSPEVRERAVRMVLTGEHEHRSRWAAVQSVAAKIGCTPQTLLVDQQDGDRLWHKARCYQQHSERLKEVGFKASVGSAGDAYDNALAETINGLYKAEVIHKDDPWKGQDDVERATLTWVDWFNNRRLLGTTDHNPPAEYGMLYYRNKSAQAA